MASVNNHGGQCCGMRHIYEFRRDVPRENANDLVRLTTQNGLGDERLQLEVILSDRQTRNNPELLEELARLGYVYTSSWTGGHGTPVHLFLRAKRRLALSAANFYNRWVTDLNGMVPHVNLSGPLPLLRENEPVNNNRPLREGDRVRVVVHGPRQGQEGVVSGIDIYGHYQVRYDLDGRISTFSLRDSVELANEPAVEPREPVVYRHVVNPPQQAPNQPRRLLLSQFYCVFRGSGNASRVFNSLADGVEAFPNARDWRERKVYSDGEIVEGPVNHG